MCGPRPPVRFETEEITEPENIRQIVDLIRSKLGGIAAEDAKMDRPLNVLLFGGCLVHWPMTRTSKARGRLRCDTYGPIREIHSFGEMFQIVEILRGERKLPRESQRISWMTELRPVTDAANFSNIDVALLEPASPIELSFRGIAFNRSAINVKFLKPIVDRGGEERKAAAAWLRQGLVGMNETIRAEAAAKLASYVPGASRRDEFARALFLETRSSRTDVLGGFIKMREMLNRPIGVVSYVFRYMPDGRPISWPAGFREEVLDAAQRLDLPVFDPSPLVQSFGIESALGPDLGHYSERFMPVAATGLIEFARNVHRSAKLTTAQASALAFSAPELGRIVRLWLWSISEHLRLGSLARSFRAMTRLAAVAIWSGKGTSWKQPNRQT